MSALAPTVAKLTKWGIPRVLASVLVFLLVVAFLATIITLGFTPLITQTSRLFQRLAESLGFLLQTNLIDQSLINQELTNFSRQLISFGLGLFENLLGLVSVIVVTFYLLLDKDKVENFITSLFGERREKARRLLGQIEGKLGAWLRGQLILSLIVGVLVYIGLVVLGIEFALSLAIIAALLEIVPVIGPIIAAVPAVLIAFTISPLLALLVAGLYLAVQQIEGHVIVPQVMKRAVGLNPLLVIFAVIVGGRLLGIGGALLAVPIAVVIQVILEEFLHISPKN